MVAKWCPQLRVLSVGTLAVDGGSLWLQGCCLSAAARGPGAVAETRWECPSSLVPRTTPEGPDNDPDEKVVNLSKRQDETSHKLL